MLMLGMSLWHRRFSGSTWKTFPWRPENTRLAEWDFLHRCLVSPDAATGYGGLAVVTGALFLVVPEQVWTRLVFWRRIVYRFLATVKPLYHAGVLADLRFSPRAAAAMRLWDSRPDFYDDSHAGRTCITFTGGVRNYGSCISGSQRQKHFTGSAHLFPVCFLFRIQGDVACST